MSIQVISGGCRGVDLIAMYWADVFNIPFHCFLASHHAMYYDIEEDSTVDWCIGLSESHAGCLFKRRAGMDYDHLSIVCSMVEHHTLPSRFTVASKEDLEAEFVCQSLNSNFTKYTPVSKAYLQRNYLIAKNCDSVIAFGYLCVRGQKSFVTGGTGWTTRLVQRLVKPLYLYDITDRIWLSYDYDQTRFILSPAAPVLQDKCAIVGDREVTLTSTVSNEIRDLIYRAASRTGLQ